MQHGQRWFGLCLLVVGLGLAACSGDDTDGGGSGGTTGGFGGTTGGTGGMTGGTGGSGGSGGMTGGMGGGGSGGMTGGMGGGGGSGPMCGSMTCASGEMCVMGECRTPCTMSSQCTGGACCGDFCTNTDEDREHCGECDNECESTQQCDEGECVAAECTPPETDEDAGVDGPDIGDNGCPENEACVGMASGNVCQCGDGPGCPLDQHCSDDGECRCGDSEGCDTGDTCCGNDCFDLQTDEANCGECGNECLADSTCVAGVCTCPDSDESPCEDGCFNFDDDEDNCGGCGVECATGATCQEGKCECNQTGFIPCNGVCVDGDTNTNCGECGNTCNPPDYTCRKPAGLPLDCYCFNVNEVSYCPSSMECVDLDNDPNNCGECGKTCEGPTSACREGVCACPTVGESPCGDTCVNLSNDAENCGQCDLECVGGGATGACVNGLCACTTPSQRFCDEDPDTGADFSWRCINVGSSEFSCGACRNRCIDSSCVAGTCDCPNEDEEHCPDVGCMPTDTDEANCGGCGIECPTGSTCVNGVCDCPGASSIEACRVDGELTCLNTATDPDHCGECDNDCTGDETCCAGGCRDAEFFQDDPNNCGRCGNDCGEGCGFFDPTCECNNGACECPPGESDTDGDGDCE